MDEKNIFKLPPSTKVEHKMRIYCCSARCHRAYWVMISQLLKINAHINKRMQSTSFTDFNRFHFQPARVYTASVTTVLEARACVRKIRVNLNTKVITVIRSWYHAREALCSVTPTRNVLWTILMLPGKSLCVLFWMIRV